jgi:membrane-associated phospholipid phosphatase
MRLHVKIKGKYRDSANRFGLWVNRHLSIARVFILAVSFVVFLVLLPSYIRDAFWYGLRSNRFLAGILAVFILLAISLIWTAGQILDAWVFNVFNLQGPRPLWLDKVMGGITQLGSAVAALVIALILYLVNSHLLAYEMVLGTISLWLVVEVVKFLVQRSRPFIRMVGTRIVGYRASGRSFPSGHTSQIFFLATLMTQHFHPNWWIVLLLYAVASLVGITRMYVGAHYPRDVLAGAILGTAWGLLGVVVNQYRV